MHIKVTQGLDIPLKGAPKAYKGELSPSETIGIDLTPFENCSLNLRVKVGDRVRSGDPIAEDRNVPGRVIVTPMGGAIKEINRGLKRALLNVVVSCDESAGARTFPTVESSQLDRESLIQRLMDSGLLVEIISRPCHRVAHPQEQPKSIFVQACSSAPYDPPFELEIEDEFWLFQLGLSALSKIAPVHLVIASETSCEGLKTVNDVTLHTVEGPHPSGNPSLHIYHIDPLLSPEERIWTLNASTVIAIGRLLKEGRVTQTRIIALAGEPFAERQGFYRVKRGQCVQQLLGQAEPNLRVISGNPLTGKHIASDGHLGFFDRAITLIPESHQREPLHFFRLGLHKFTATRTYLSGLLRKRGFTFTTNQHGERRAFIDGSIYAKMMPMRIPVMPLIKALLAEDFELAQELGFLEVDAEDFALPEFICPSKIPLTEIVHKAQREFARNYLA